MIIPGFFNNSGKRLSILVHFTFGEQALDQFSGNRVNDKHGGRAKNHIRRTGGIRTPHDFAASSGTILNLNVPGELPGTCLVSTSQNINFFPAAFLKFVF